MPNRECEGPEEQPSTVGPPGHQIPQRTLRDPQELRAFAHPLRLRLLTELAARGTATATELAEVVGESPSACSWHLRLLARFGHIEEAEDRAGRAGRQRPWKVVVQAATIPGAPQEDSEAREATLLAAETVTNLMVERLFAWERTPDEADPEWKRATHATASGAFLTVDETRALSAELQEVYERHLAGTLDRMDPSRRPPGCRMINYVSWVLPAGGPETETPAGGPGAEASNDEPAD